MRKADFAGTGEVFRFTLRQYLKSKSTIASMVVMLVISIASLFIASVSMSNGIVERTNIKAIAIANETEYEISEADVRDANPLLADASVFVFADEQSAEQASTVLTALVTVRRDESGALAVSSKAAGELTELDDSDLSLAAGAVSSALEAARYRSLDITKEQLAMATANYSSSVQTVGEYLTPDAGSDVNFSARFLVTYVYSILVMVLVLFSASYIVRAVIEEKASKLIEFLMVSVKPLALILGKILASMCLVLIQLCLLVAGFAASWWVSTSVLGVSAITELIESAGLREALVNLNLFSVVIVVVSVLLGYFTFSLLGGLAGVRCSSMEDVESANLSVVLTVMLGYLVSVVLAGFDTKTVAIAASLIPVISTFAAPVRYVTGEISFAILALSWVVQALVIVFLAQFCQRVYGVLLMRRGSRVRFKELFAISKSVKGGEGA